MSLYLTIQSDYLKPGAWHLINRDSFKDLFLICRHAIPAMTMKGMEIFNFEAMTILSGWLGINEQAASATIMLVIYVFLFKIFSGIASVASNMVGNTIYLIFNSYPIFHNRRKITSN